MACCYLLSLLFIIIIIVPPIFWLYVMILNKNNMYEFEKSPQRKNLKKISTTFTKSQMTEDNSTRGF